MKRASRPKFLAAEVIQTSSMDCGPAALKCLMEGFHIPVSFGRLREACQTDVDGTSTDALEEVANQLGLNAEQVMLPADHLFLSETRALPALLVVRQANGVTHFIVAWRKHGQFIQIMDPASGRRWVRSSHLLQELYIHEQIFPAEAWTAWACSEGFMLPLKRRLLDVGLASRQADARIADLLENPAWESIGLLDAATRMIQSLIQAKALDSGKDAVALLDSLIRDYPQHPKDAPPLIPLQYWTVMLLPPENAPDNSNEPTGLASLDENAQLQPEPEPEEAHAPEEFLRVFGTVLIQVHGAHTEASKKASEEDRSAPSAEIAQALEEEATPARHILLDLLKAGGLQAPTILGISMLAAAAALLLETLLYEALLDLHSQLVLPWQRLDAIVALLIFLAGLLLLEFPIVLGLLYMGRQLESRLRIAFLEKIPLLGDRYFRSRPSSDMADRSHSAHYLRTLPDFGAQLLRGAAEMGITIAALVWISPHNAPLIFLMLLLIVFLPLGSMSILKEMDLKARTHIGALSRFYLDALLGLVAIRSHGAEKAVRGEHESLLVEWAKTARALLSRTVLLNSLYQFMGLALVVWILASHYQASGANASMLLVLYWSLHLFGLGQGLVMLGAQQYSAQRSFVLRLLEPLGALEEHDPIVGDDDATPPGAPVEFKPVTIRMEDVTVKAAGHTILENINLQIEPGSHIAIVGPSGAGKSSLAGLLLGWHRPANGVLLVDDKPLEGSWLEHIRHKTAWVDPAVQVWNSSLLDNLVYAAGAAQELPIAQAIDQAELRKVLERMPEGLQTSLGEGGALVSGGEGQRVRFARALLQKEARLVLLDEPFRGLDREKRRELLTRAQQWWKDTTLLCITHDVGETLAFDRVLVVEGGHIVEDGDPVQLADNPESRYRTILEAEEEVRVRLWASAEWRKIRLDRGQLW